MTLCPCGCRRPVGPRRRFASGGCYFRIRTHAQSVALGELGGAAKARNWERRLLAATAKCPSRDTAVLLAYQMGLKASARKRYWATVKAKRAA